MAAEAAVWVARLHGPSRSRDMERECLAWQARSAAHRLAFERCTETWQDIPRISLSAAYSAGSGPSVSSQAVGWRAHRRLAAGLALGVFVLGSGVAVLVQHWRSAGVYATGVGEQRVVLLGDGTRMSLNTASRVRVDLGSSSRVVSVEDGGEVLFEVAKDARRPFVVRAGGSEIIALGTSFSVRVAETSSAERDSLAVTLLEGRVTVRTIAQGHERVAPASPVAMEPGERLTLVKAGGAPKVVRDRPRADQLLAWRRSEAVFDDVSLSEAVEEMNRYSRTQIVLVGDPSAGARRVSGQFRTGDNLAFARAVAAVHGLALREQPGRLEISAPQ
ncbi:FecR family protein [Aquabacterium humicola]|uniref:FecR family protein n=1 Tax=Aquabacterium humicola TaxID=3237377 RepID=UPI002543D174|nr:FecR domain-containing protein [Rubrivivax pictus]